MTTAQAIAAIAAGAGPDTEAYRTYYGAGGAYSQALSVQAAAAESAAAVAPLPDGPPAPMLYPAQVCGAAEMIATDCVAHNAAVQQANLALQENARRAWNLRVCEHNAALTPGTAQDVQCGQYRGDLPVPAVPGNPPKQPAVCSGGQCYTPFVGGAADTPQQQASMVSGKPNQTVPPKGQPGEVPRDGGGSGGGTAAPSGDGKIFGMDPLMLAVVAGVGALLLLRK
jgi:hypothetical protein